MQTITLGHSVSGLPIMAYEWGEGPHILIMSGVHGDEIEGVFVGYRLLGEFSKGYSYQIKLTLIPFFNPDGILQNRRTNENFVDLNRNLPTKDWTKSYSKEKYHPGPEPNSEPENKMFVNWLEKNKPQLIISLHSWKPVLNVNGHCSPEADILSQETGYKVVEDIGYPTPGSLGAYAGQERDIPTITYEIERGSKFQDILKLHIPAIKKALEKSQHRKF